MSIPEKPRIVNRLQLLRNKETRFFHWFQTLSNFKLLRYIFSIRVTSYVARKWTNK